MRDNESHLPKYQEGMGRIGRDPSPRSAPSNAPPARRVATLFLGVMLGITGTELLGVTMLNRSNPINTASRWENVQHAVLSLEGNGNATSVSGPASSSRTTRTATPVDGDHSPLPHPNRSLSPLEVLYGQTGNGTRLRDWVLRHVQRTYPHFPDDDGLRLGNPSVAHDPSTNRTVLGFRITTESMPRALRHVSYLMLCEPARDPPGATAANARDPTWRCQDSGMENAYIPPECDTRHWRNPTEHVLWGMMTVGPEDARLLFDEDGSLGATMVMRGCHPYTKWGRTTPLGSMYTMRWRRSHDTWRVAGYPKVLDLRTHQSHSLGDTYPEVTKSWITVPSLSGGAKAASHADPVGRLRFSVGWTRDMRRHVVYQVSEASDTLYAVTPLRKDVEYSSLDMDAYRGSTNVVPFRGALLGIGHRKVGPEPSLYEHYWYAYCPDPPHYSAVALSDGFILPKDRSILASFALGLAGEGDKPVPAVVGVRQAPPPDLARVRRSSGRVPEFRLCPVAGAPRVLPRGGLGQLRCPVRRRGGGRDSGRARCPGAEPVVVGLIGPDGPPSEGGQASCRFLARRGLPPAEIDDCVKLE
jgi:hypothetical protein